MNCVYTFKLYQNIIYDIFLILSSYFVYMFIYFFRTSLSLDNHSCPKTHYVE